MLSSIPKTPLQPWDFTLPDLFQKLKSKKMFLFTLNSQLSSRQSSSWAAVQSAEAGSWALQPGADTTAMTHGALIYLLN